MNAKRFGRYRVLDEVGEGNFGIVYRARDERLGREVALKVLREGCLHDAAIRARFETEARVLSRLNHPNIEILYDFESRDGHDFLVMEFVSGETLQRKIALGAIPEKDVIRLGVQICDALEAAHAKGVVHRDLKPGNLMVRPDGTLKVLDFGLAKYLGSKSEPDSIEVVTQTGNIVGTPPYLTPEQLRGEAAEARSDLHCVGAVLYEMSTGRRPFTGSGTTLFAEILNRPPPEPRSINSSVSHGLEAVIMKCLAKRLESRFQTAADLGAALGALGSAQARRERRQKGTRQRRWRVYAPATGVALLLLLAALVPRLWPAHSGVAVLPFDNLGPGEQDYYAEAVADQLFSKLVQISDLPVTPRTSARAVDKKQPIREVAGLLGVDTIVDGTVLRAEGQIRVSISVSSIKRRWPFGQVREETIYADERTFAESKLFRELGEFATEISARLARELKPEDRERLADQREIDPEAFDRYARGRHEWSRRTPQAFQNAIQFFGESILADSTFAPAYAGLADCYALFGSFGYDIRPPREVMPQALAYAKSALDHDESLPEAHTALAHILHNYEWDWEGAQREFERAIALSPGDATPYQWYGFLFATLGQLDEAIAWQTKGLELDPNSAVTLASLARMHYYKRDYGTAIETVERALELDQNFMPATILQGVIYLALGHLDEAREVFEAGRVVTKGAPVFEAGLGAVHAVSGDMQSAERVIQELEARAGYVPSFYPAAVYVKMGDHESALQWLEKAVDERFEAVLYLGVDPWMDGLRSDSRFQDLLQRVGLPTEPAVSGKQAVRR